MSKMLDEIRQQPAALERLLRSQARPLAKIQRRFSAAPPASIVLAARGTSDNAATFARYLFEIVLGIPTALAAPSISTVYGRAAVGPGSLVIGISQSGESTDTNLYLENAKRSGGFTIGITNEPKSSLAGLADEALLVKAGRERSVAATKTYTGQLMMIYRLAQALGAAIPDAALERVPELVADQLALAESVRDLSERYRFMTHAVVVGRGLNYSNAFEFSLKMMETCYVLAERFSGADFAHGPIALVEQGFPVFAFAAPGPTLQGSRELLERLRNAGAETVVVGPARITKGILASRKIDLGGQLPKVRGRPDDLMMPIPAIIPAQLFAAFLAEHKGLDPDQPRLLSKVTRTI